MERERAKLADALATAKKEVERLKGECGRLQGEARKAALAATGAADAKVVPTSATQASPATASFLMLFAL